MPNPNELNTNRERVLYVQGQLVVMAELERVHREGQIDVAGEAIEISGQVKANMKQKLNAAKVDCITALNAIKLQ